MKTFTVHARTDLASPEDEAADLRFVKEGFSWLALFFPLLWLLFNRMWLVLLGWLAVGIALAAVSNFWPAAEGGVTVVALLFALWFAFEANGLRRWSLAGKGHALIDVVVGRNRGEAELAFFRRRELGLTGDRPVAGQASPGGHGPAYRAGRRGDHVVGGLFEGGR